MTYPTHLRRLPPLTRTAVVVLKALAGLFLVFFLTKAGSFLFWRGFLTVNPLAIFAPGAIALGFVGVLFGSSLRVLERSTSILLPYAAMCLIAVASFAFTVPGNDQETALLFSDFTVYLFALMLAGVRLGVRTWRTTVYIALVITTVTLVV